MVLLCVSEGGKKVKKITYIFILIILFFSSFGGTYLYLSEKYHTMPVFLNQTNQTQERTSNSDNLNKSSSDDNMSLTKSVNIKKVKDRSIFNKEVFLTFDDGPSINTLKILKILDDNNVKATFFVIGSNVDAHPNLVKAEYKDGMTILNHSYTHNYSMYKSIETCIADFNRCNVSVKNAIGTDLLPYIRFPGGSDNKVSDSKTMNNIRNEFISKGMEYIDWNSDAGDADKGLVSTGTIEHNLLKQLGSTNFAVTLMHDSPAKTTTVEALPAVIYYLKKQGFVFRTFADLTPTEEKKMVRERIIDRGTNK